MRSIVGANKRRSRLFLGAAIRLEGQVSSLLMNPIPTYRQLSQLFGQNVLSCVEGGVLAPIVGIVVQFKPRSHQSAVKNRFKFMWTLIVNRWIKPCVYEK